MLKDAALRGISQFFRGSCEEEVTRFLASVVLSPENSNVIRLTAYGYLWQVSEVGLKGAPPVKDSKRNVTIFPGAAEYQTDDLAKFASSLTSFAARINHFTFQLWEPGFSIDDDIHWDWVKSFVSG